MKRIYADGTPVKPKRGKRKINPDWKNAEYEMVCFDIIRGIWIWRPNKRKKKK
jgi:hypothetical protein